MKSSVYMVLQLASRCRVKTTVMRFDNAYKATSEVQLTSVGSTALATDRLLLEVSESTKSFLSEELFSRANGLSY